MSHSPAQDATSEEIRAYDVGWAATNQLIRAGKSFSGRERNCVFLNIGDEKRFADISAVSGMDFPDDGRGLALTDWDHDGRVDLWIMNRTGPRVRFIKNQLKTENQFVALRLQGKNGNGAGIGAHVRVLLKADQNDSPALVKTLHAGSGYLSQSSKWLHFGLGSADEASIKAVEVQWPGGEPETFAGVIADGHFILHQGTGSATQWQPPSVSAEAFAEVGDALPAPPEVPSRVVLLRPAPVPSHLTFLNDSGEEESLANRFKDQPTVLNLWATWCPNCEEEMIDWKEAAKHFKDAGVRVLSICVDEPSDDRQADLAKAKAKAVEFGYPFEIGLANAALIENLNVLQRTFIGRQSDLPLPATLLVDQSGKACAVYKGPVSAAQLAEDAKICGADSSKILSQAIPYSGKWKTPPKGVVPRGVAVKMISSGLLDDARSYLHQLLPDYEGSAEAEAVKEAAECHRILGAIAHQKGEHDLAITHYQKSLEIIPDQKPVRTELMRVYLAKDDVASAAREIEAILTIERNDYENLAQLGKLRAREGKNEEAISLFRESLALRFHPETSAALADELRDQGDCAAAIKHYAASLEAHPKNILTANNYAWILATHPDPKLRDGAKAEQWAKVACDETGNRIPPLLGTLAAAYAELGQFDRAVEISQKAITSAQEFGKEDLAARLESKMKSYQNGKPFRDASLVLKPGK